MTSKNVEVHLGVLTESNGGADGGSQQEVIDRALSSESPQRIAEQAKQEDPEVVHSKPVQEISSIEYIELPGWIFHIIRFMDDPKSISKWLSSRGRKFHVDVYRCKSYISSTESVTNLTALLLACLYNRPKTIAVLLNKGADISLKDNLGRNALHCVCASKSEGPITTAFKIIMERIANKPLKLVPELVNNRETRYGRTPFMEGCHMNRSEPVIMLCKSRLITDVCLKDNENMTPLHYVCTSPCDKVEPLMFDTVLKMSDIHARDKQGRTPFLVACEHSKPDLAKKLLRAGSIMHMEDLTLKTALQYLSAARSDKKIEELLAIISRRYREGSVYS